MDRDVVHTYGQSQVDEKNTYPPAAVIIERQQPINAGILTQANLTLLDLLNSR